MGKGGHETSEAPMVPGFPSTHSLGREMCVLDGTNLRRLRDGLCRFSPGIILQAKRLRKHFWKIIRSSLLDICDRNILTSEVIRSNSAISVITENFLDKWVRTLAKYLSELPGKTDDAVVKNRNVSA